MSSFQDKHDRVLRDVPWLSKEIDGQAWLFKYASHPERAGYVVLATNLEQVYFESVTGEAISARLNELSQSSQKRSESQIGSFNIMARVDDTLTELGGIMSERWQDNKLKAGTHHFYDKVFSIQDGDFEWSFFLSELELRRCLSLIGQHLVLPLARMIGKDNSISVSPSSTPSLAIAMILQDETVADKLNAQAGPSATHPEQEMEHTLSPKASPHSTREELEEETQDYKSGGDDHEKVEETQPPPSTQRPNLDPPAESAPVPSPTLQDNNVMDSDEEDEAAREAPADVKVPESLGQNAPDPPPKASQKSKKEREREEEEEVEKRREEMKRKMENGGGGRLGKRKLRR
ncbi:hypothetical protein BD324DRAFT_630196 [Kockovaella imperatae]|uniref:XLF-like N-terminal domain-containing protein n=1 Tax=Kockovaella imperatae TaxID=4999 RepID=A0A1Y1UF22_9TREE|nr:hypothetical protein BD324DRAFT_630196 [Kockovaella imperatae]ORX36106.1 hypothetical protein BD324DRAFT_630196 [Kockovaella imperatae]